MGLYDNSGKAGLNSPDSDDDGTGNVYDTGGDVITGKGNQIYDSGADGSAATQLYDVGTAVESTPVKASHAPFSPPVKSAKAKLVDNNRKRGVFGPKDVGRRVISIVYGPGTVRFVGKHNKKGTPCIGLELDEVHDEGHNGSQEVMIL